MKIYRIVVPIMLAICLCATPARPQTEQDRIIVGEHLASLWTAVNRGVVKLSNDEFKAQIRKFQLSAILIPRQQTGGRYVVRRCFKIKTAFDEPDLTVTQADYEQLLGYATKVVFQKAFLIKESLLNGDSQAAERETAALKGELDGRPEAERAAEREFVGAVLAEVEPTQPVLSAYVKEYRKTVEGGLSSKLAAGPKSGELTPGVPYIVGTLKFTVADLARVNPALVDQVTVNNRTYRRVWLGSTLIFVPQTEDALKFWEDPTGLGLSADWVSSVRSTKAARTTTLTMLPLDKEVPCGPGKICS